MQRMIVIHVSFILCGHLLKVRLAPHKTFWVGSCRLSTLRLLHKTREKSF